MASKVKSKDDKIKDIRSTEDDEELDLALLRKPINTSITGLAQARKIFELATEELKDLLANECDIMYECKVCRNVFRSLANFISHKRIYCKEKFNKFIHGHFVNTPIVEEELRKIHELEDAYRRSMQNIDMDAENDSDRIPMTNDLTTIVEKLNNNKAVSIFSNNNDITLRRIPSSGVAVFQNVNYNHKRKDNMQAEVAEITQILSRDKAVLQSDGKFKIQSHVNFRDNENIIHISDDEDGENLKCKICDQKFSTMKTMKFHMKYKHLESRLVYPCPDCLEIFSTSWSVYRHLFKVHRKSAAQIRKLREIIQAKAFKLNNPPGFYEKHKSKSISNKPTLTQNMTEEERLDQENQEWMDKMECDGDVPRCGGCGRTFERRAALSAHMQTCQSRSKALTRKPEAKKIEIQIRKDYLKTPAGKVLGEDTLRSEENSTKEDNPENVQEDTEKPENVKEDTDKAENITDETDDVDHVINDTEEVPETQDETDKSSENAVSLYQYQMDDIIPSIQLPFAQQTEKSNMTALKQKMEKDIVLSQLMCKICSEKYNHIQKLFDHMATHYKWMRYACKLCNFKHYSFDKLPVHVKEVHKLKGDSDFYFSTVKALDGAEALELIQNEDQNNENDLSSDSRRPSSDSSRMSEDSSPVNVRVDASTKKRKIGSSKPNPKKRKNNDGDDDASMENGDTDSVISKTFDENSSDMDDIEERLQKRTSSQEVKVPYRRPVRKRTVPKNADFEYDLSNLLEKEGRRYRESQQNPSPTKIVTTPSSTSKNVQSAANTKTVPNSSTKTISSSNTNTKSSQAYSKPTLPAPPTVLSKNSQAPVTKTSLTKDKKERKSMNENIDYPTLVKQCYGALASLTRRSVMKAQAHLKTAHVPTTNKRPNIFMRPRDIIPKILARASERESPKNADVRLKESNPEHSVDEPGNKEVTPGTEPLIVTSSDNNKELRYDETKEDKRSETLPEIKVKDIADLKEVTVEKQVAEDSATRDKEQNKNLQNSSTADNTKKPQQSFSSSGSLKLGNESIEKVMKNPILNKNINELKKAGLKTKILVIKPINRNKDGTQTLNPQLKFQTIKLKDSNKGSNEDSSGEQVLFVKVPKVDCAVRNVNEKNAISNSKLLPADTTLTINNPEKTDHNKKDTDEESTDVAEITHSNTEIEEKEKSCENAEISGTVVIN